MQSSARGKRLAAASRVAAGIALALAGLGSEHAAAVEQDSAGNAADACAEIRSDRERLRCYDRAAGGRRTEDEPQGTPSTARPSAAVPSTAPSRSRSAARPRVQGPDDARAADQSFEVVIVAVRRDRSPNATFITDTGQVWRQTSGKRPQLDDPPFAAEIRPGALGSYFLVPAGRLAIRVHEQR